MLGYDATDIDERIYRYELSADLLAPRSSSVRARVKVEVDKQAPRFGGGGAG